MKKIITVAVFMVLSTVVHGQKFGQEGQYIRTSSGKVWIVISGLIGKYEGQSFVNTTRPLTQNPQYLTLTNRDHKEIVDKVLSNYVTSAGDTFLIMFNGSKQHSNYTPDYMIVCEIDGDGSYDYWLWYNR